MYQYPYGNAQQLNLDWILNKIQELESGSGGVSLEAVANALVSASFDTGVSYRRYDYCFYNGKLYRALNDNSGAFNPSDWLEVVLGDDIPVLTRLLNAVDTSLTTLQGQVNDLDSDDVANASTVSGTSVTDALDTLYSLITTLSGAVAVSTETELFITTKPIRTTVNIALGSTGVTLEAYARGIVISDNGINGCVLAVGYNGNVYAGYFTNSIFVKAQVYNNNAEYLTLTANQNFVSSSGVICRKANNLVVLTGSLVTNANAVTNDILLSGFPVPPSAVDICGTIIEATDTSLRGKAGRYRIKTDGTLVPWYNTWGASSSGTTILFNASYFI